MKRPCVNCKKEFEYTKKTKNRKYCDSCKLSIWYKQKKDWSRKKAGTFGKPRLCHYCKVELGDDAKTDRIYCVNCAVIRDKILHHISYKKRKKIMMVIRN